jgi:predicted ATPase/class 3 adenylate cyclase
MADLPTGIATFVFTDIEASTTMLQRLGTLYVEVLEDHDRIIRQSFGQLRGVEVSNEGDAFFYAFGSAADAVAAALDAQRKLHRHSWPDGGTVRIRVGLHTGAAELGGTNYVGIAVNKAARISAAGHGGQVLLSGDAVTAAGDTLGDGVSLIDLGEHRFKDLDEPTRVYQALAADLPGNFPPIRSLDTRPNNLPSVASEFVGRAAETDRVCELVEAARVVSLVGPGGTGKTRLAINVASRLLPRYRDGVTFVSLESIEDPELVSSAVATALEVDVGDRPATETVTHALRESHKLLVLDNFEHVLDARTLVGTIVERAPDVTVLVTSRVLLRVRGEHVFNVPPMSTGDGVELFIARAAAADPLLDVGEAERAVIDGIVARLDSLPLAIELAAARVRLFGVAGLADRLSDRLAVLTSGADDAPGRHRTLRNTISWSHDLLDASAKLALAQLSVFVGGFTLDAAEAIVDPAHGPVEAVATLLDGSIIDRRLIAGETRFTMLDSIRDFASEQLAASGQEAMVRKRHAEYFAELARAARDLLEGPAQMAWLQRLGDEHDNLRAVARYCLEAREPDRALVAVGASWRFWHRRGHLVEARDVLTRLLALPGADPVARTEGLNGRAAIAYWLGDYESAERDYVELLPIFEGLGATSRVAETLFGLSTTVAFLGALDRAFEYADAAKEAYERAGDSEGSRRVSAAKSFVAWQAGKLEESLELWSSTRDLYEQAGDIAEALQTQAAMAAVTHRLGRTPEAIGMLIDVLGGMWRIEDVAGTVMAVDLMAAVVATRDPVDGVTLAGAAARHRESLGGGLAPEAVGLPTARQTADGALEPQVIEEAWQRGQALDLDATVGFARSLRV